jgi:hypothetical protein
MNPINLILVALIVLLAPVLSQAQSFYVQGGLGMVKRYSWNYQQMQNAPSPDADHPGNLAGTGFGDKNNSGQATQLAAGWQFAPSYALELGYVDFGKADIQYTRYRTNLGVTDIRRITVPRKSDAWTLAVKANITTDLSYNPYVKLGVAQMTLRESWVDPGPGLVTGTVYKDKRNSARMLWSLGLEHEFDERYSAYLELSGFDRVGAFDKADWDSGNPAGIHPTTLMLGLRYGIK